jgi:putative flippase GtrA
LKVLPENLLKIQRFVISGSTGALVHFFVLILLTEFVKTNVIFATTIAFVYASVISFSMQKIWTFQNRSLNIKYQASSYLLVGGINIFLNGFLMHFFVFRLDLNYIFSQFLTSGLIALESYFFYKHIVFKSFSEQEE